MLLEFSLILQKFVILFTTNLYCYDSVKMSNLHPLIKIFDCFGPEFIKTRKIINLFLY